MLWRGAGEVADDLVAGNGHGRVDGEVALWRLEHVLPLETPVGQTRDRRTDNAFRVVEELVHRRDDAVASASLAELGQAPLRERVGGELGAEVPATFLGVAILATRSASSSSSRRVGGMTIPSSASVREPAGMLPGSAPPTSAWCARVTAKPTSVGDTSVTSGRCVPPAYGSLRMKTSPRAGSWRMTAATASDIAPR